MNAPTTFEDTCDNYLLVRGWTPDRQVEFLDHLAQKGNVRAACGCVGLSREAAYRLRRRDPLFARGWAAALIQAHEASIEVLADRAIDGVEEDVWHRGELVGTRRKYDTRLLLAHIARLDKAARDRAAQADAARFDELLARISGEPLPPNLDSDDGVLPVDRLTAAMRSAEEAQAAVCAAQDCESADVLDETVLDAREHALAASYEDGYAEGEARFDAWLGDACLAVDFYTGRLADEIAPGLPGGAPLAGPGEGTTEEAALFAQDTVNSVNLSGPRADC